MVVQLVSKGVVEPTARRIVELLFLGARNRNSEEEVEQPGDSPVLLMHDGITQVNFCSCDSRRS